MKNGAVESGIISFIVTAMIFSFIGLIGIFILYLLKTTGLSIYLLIIGVGFLMFSARVGAFVHEAKRDQAKMYEQLFGKDTMELWFMWGYRTGLSADIWLIRVIGLGLLVFSICMLCGLIIPFLH